MRRFIGILLLTTLVGLVLIPLVVARACKPQDYDLLKPDEGIPITVRVFRTEAGELVSMDLEQYVAGVLAAEMPARFHIEALKAGAVVARTYAVRRLRSRGGSGCSKHPQADVCDDPACHQAYSSIDELRSRWGFFSFFTNWNKIVSATEATSGLIIIHNDKPIDAVYHSTCGGHTECAGDEWGNEVSYLRPVECLWDKHSPWHKTFAAFTRSELATVFSGISIDIVSRTPTGRVRKLASNGELFSGFEVRSLLDLRSTWFDVELQGDEIVFSVRGHGHGVGLCQYGADGLGREGADFPDILMHYYHDVELIWLEDYL